MDLINKIDKYLNEAVTFHIDVSKNDLERYVAYDGKNYYTAVIGVQSDAPYVKFKMVRAGKNGRLSSIKLKDTDEKSIEKEIGMRVDFKKLYKN